MKPYFINFLLVFWGNLLFAQHIQFNWQTCFNNPLYDKASDIISTNDGFLIVGYSQITEGGIPPNGDDYDIWLIKTDIEGQLLWQKFIGGSYFDGGVRILPSNNGTFFILACSFSNDGDITFNPYPESLNYWIIKIDGSGNILWDKMAGGNSYDELITGTPTHDGGIVSFGCTASSNGDITNYYGYYDMWMIKLDSTGEKRWDFSIGTEGAEYGQALIETSDHGFLAGGASLQMGAGNIDCIPQAETADAILFKLDSNANVQWQYCYGGSEHDGITALCEVSDGYIFGAYTTSSDGDVSGCGYHIGYNQLGDPTHDIWIVKVNFEGIVIWKKCFGGSTDEFVNQIYQTSDGKLMIFGTTSSNDENVIGNHSRVDGFANDIWMLKVSSTGNLIWQRCIGGIGNEMINSGVIQLNDDKYAIVSTTEGGSNGDITCGNYPEINFGVWAFQVSDTSNVGLPHLSQISDKIKLYPNPVYDHLWVDIPAEFSLQHAIVQVIDARGKIVLEQTPVSSKFQLNIHENTSGLYLMRLINDKVSATKKFIIN